MCFSNFKGVLGFSVPSIILADLLGNTCLLVIGVFRSTWFVSVFQGLLIVIALFRTVSGNDWLVLFAAFYDLSYSCLLQESNVCLLPSTKIPLIIAISFAFLEQFRVILNFVFAGQAGLGECVALWFALTPPPLKWLTEQKNPFEICKHAARYNKFGHKWCSRRKHMSCCEE